VRLEPAHRGAKHSPEREGESYDERDVHERTALVAVLEVVCIHFGVELPRRSHEPCPPVASRDLARRRLTDDSQEVAGVLSELGVVVFGF
jgi:hypothetical protein